MKNLSKNKPFITLFIGYRKIYKLTGVFTSTRVTGYKGIRVTFLHLNTLQKVTLIPFYPVTPVLVNTPNVYLVRNQFLHISVCLKIAQLFKK